MRTLLAGLELLGIIATARQPLRAREIVERTDMPRATVYRALNSLEASGWLISRDSPKRFSPSLRLAGVGLAALSEFSEHDVLFAAALELTQQTGMNSIISVADGDHAIYLERVGWHAERISVVPLGHRLPALSTAPGKILLTYKDPETIENVIQAGLPKMAPNTKTTPEELRREIEITRASGYGYAENESVVGSAGVAMAVLNAKGEAVAALSLGAGIPVPPDYPDRVLDALRAVTEQASMILGYRPPILEAIG